MSKRTAALAMYEREQIMQLIESHGKYLSDSGARRRWFMGCDAGIMAISRLVHGPLMEEIRDAAGHPDKDVVELFRVGAALMGLLPRSGVGEEVAHAVLPHVH